MLKHVLYNGNELLAASFVLITIGLVARKSAKAGIFAALAGLAKYDSLVIIIILPFLKKNKAKAVLYGILVTTPWLLFNYLFFGNPIESYLFQIGEIQKQANSYLGFATTVLSVIWYPLAAI